MALPNALHPYNFPDAYDSLVDAFTGTIKYISASTGSNSNTGNSVGAAYLTIDYALAQNTSATATMFVILEGTYTVTGTTHPDGYSTFGLKDGGNHREFVCAPGRVTIQFNATSGERDSPIIGFSNTNSKIYGAILKRNNNGRTTNYTVAYFRMGSAKGNFYNCVFSETNPNNAWSYQYDNNGTNNLALRNCTFYHLAAPAGNYSNDGTCLTIDSVFNTTVTTGGTETNVLKSQTVNDTTYVTTGVTTAGVYSGTYAWNGSITYPPGFGPLTPTTAVSGSTINLTYYHATSSATVNYTITGVSSADINNTSLTGSLTVTDYATTISIPTKTKINTTNTLTITIGSYTASITITPGVTVRYLVVAGGGGAGSNMGGGGGAGGYLAGTGLSISGSNNIVIGAGGAGAIAGTASPAGSNGQNTTALGLTAIGGGGGASSHNTSGSPAGNGGSGGGGSGGRQSSGSYGGLPGTGTAGQGNNGAASGVTWYPGGGGGAGADATQTGSQQANGGIGLDNDILGTSYYWAGGGAGAGYTVYGGNGGLGGGGGGAPRQSDAVTTNGQGGGSALNSGSVAEIGITGSQTNKRGGAGGVNTGGGGGGGSHYSVTNEGGAGGSGIVVIRYAGGQRAAGGTVTTVSGDTVHTFLTSSTFTVFSGGLNSSHTSAYWAETVTLTYADDLADGSTIAYTITGVTSEQIGGASLTGNFTISSSLATLSINLATRTTNTSATMVITAGAYSRTITVSNLVSFTSSVAGTYWGGSFTLTALTRGLSPGGLVPYTISGVTSAQISNTSLTGNLTVSAVGSTRLGQYSNYFDGNGDYLQTPSSVSSSLGTSNFTWECWIHRNAVTDATYADAICCVSTGTNGFAVGVNPDGKVGYAISSAGVWDVRRGVDPGDPRGSIVIPLNTWNHIALVRNGSTFTGYVNGVQDQTFTSSGSISSISSNYNIGKWHDANNRYWNGYISNFRFVIGTAVYNSAFTPPTFSLTAITGTSLLTCRSSRIIDLSTNNHTITVNGNTSVKSFNPVPTTFSNYFDGTGDYLTLPNNAFDLTSTTTWSIEYWIYPTTIASGYYGLWACSSSGLRQGIYYDSGGAHNITVLNGGSGVGTMNLTANNKVVTLNHWQHIAVTSDGTTIRQFYNGVLKGTGSAASFSSSTPTIGSWGSANTFAGYISNFRIVKGTAVYTSAFTPPTQPLVTITNTSLLTCQSNRFVDNSTNQFIITTAGNSAINSFNPNEFAYSNYFDGTGDDLSLTITDGLGSGDFTLEYWFYPTSLYNYITTFCTTRGANGFNVGTDSAGLLVWYSNSARQIQGGTIISNRWHHAAFVRSGSTLTGYLNGVSIGTATVTTNFSATAARIGSLSGGGEYITGYLSNLRVVKGTAVYTSNFVPPTESLTAIANTSLLTCQSNRFIDNSTNNLAITKNGDARIDGFIPDISFNIPSPNGIASLSIITNPSEPILNSATMVTAITGGSTTNLIRTGSPAVFRTYKPSLVSLAYIDTEITDIHSEALEARVSSLVDIGSRVNPVQFSTTVSDIVYIDTEITDIHSEALEAKVSSVSDLNAKLHVIKSDTSIAGFVAAPTFAYSSGEDVKVSASTTQTWYI